MVEKYIIQALRMFREHLDRASTPQTVVPADDSR
jgi:hypothetical protein